MTTPIYFTHGKIVAESKNIKVYDFDNNLFLEKGPGHNLWICGYEAEELYSQLDGKPIGDCLELGLGLGIASKFILSRGVDSLTTVEINGDVIEVYSQLNPEKDERHRIIEGSTIDYLRQAEEMYDFIFMDFYDVIDEDTLYELDICINLSRNILKKGGEIMGWFDPYTPEEFIDPFFELFEK